MTLAMQIIVCKIMFVEGGVIFLARYGLSDKNDVHSPVQKWAMNNVLFPHNGLWTLYSFRKMGYERYTVGVGVRCRKIVILKIKVSVK